MSSLEDLPVVVRRHGTLTANTVATIDLATDCTAVRIINRGGTGADEIWHREDSGATDPAIDDNSSSPVPIGSWDTVRAPASANTQVKLKSVGTPKYTIEGLRA